MNDLIPSNKALVPTEQIGSVYVLYCIYNAKTHFYLSTTPQYIKRKFKYFLSQTDLIRKNVSMTFNEFDEMVKYITEQKKEIPKELKIPERMMGKIHLCKINESINLDKIKSLSKQVDNYELQRIKGILGSHRFLKFYKALEILQKHQDIVVCEIKFTQQLVAFLEQTLGSKSWYVLFLREYIRKEGEDFDDYISKWARRCIINYNVMTEEELDELHRQQSEYNKKYHKLYRKKHR
jgi:hypothetical protein